MQMSTSANALGHWNATDLWRPWLQLAPSNLSQPILSGYSLNINSNNSSSPQTEADAIARHSYGRQLGRISDALRALILERHGNPPGSGPFAEFLSMWKEIEQVKIEGARSRLEQVNSDLALLKDKMPVEFTRLRDALRQTLKLVE
jgi:hypothetical protein